MKGFFAATFLTLVALSVVAWSLQPRDGADGSIPLIWCSDDNPLRRAQINPFNALHPELRLRLDPGNTGMEKIIVQSVAGVGPDLFDCYSAAQLSAYVHAGIAWDITDELERLGIDIHSETWPAVHPTAIFEGRVYGHPVNAAVNGIWFHRDMLEEAGIALPDGPWTWDEFVPIAQRLTVRNATGRVVRYGLVFDWPSNYQQFILQWGGRIYSPDGTRCVIDSPQAIAAVQFMHDLIYRHGVSPTPADETAIATAGGWGGATAMALFGARRGAMAMGGRWWLSRLRDADYRHLQLGAAEAPHAIHRVFLGYGKSTLINRESPKREEALKFLLYLNSEPYNDLINRQADGVGPVIRHAQGEEFLVNPDFPHEDFHHVWRDMMNYAVPEQVSPFVNGAVATRIIQKQLDLVRADEKPVADALRDAADKINREIKVHLRRNPELRARYDQLTGATP